VPYTPGFVIDFWQLEKIVVCILKFKT
jgi:hypothetical protein